MNLSMRERIGATIQSGCLWRHCFLEVCISIPRLFLAAIILEGFLNWEPILWTILKKLSLAWPRNNWSKLLSSWKELGVEDLEFTLYWLQYGIQRATIQSWRVNFLGGSGSRRKTGVHLGFINLSGGVGVSTSQSRNQMILPLLGRAYTASLMRFSNRLDLVMWNLYGLGRFMLASHGLLVTRWRIKKTYRTYVGVDASAVNLLRPAMYGAYHHITNMDRPDGPTKWSMSWEVSVKITINLLNNGNYRWRRLEIYSWSMTPEPMDFNGVSVQCQIAFCRSFASRRWAGPFDSSSRKTRRLSCDTLRLWHWKINGVWYNDSYVKNNGSRRKLYESLFKNFIDYFKLSLVGWLQGMFLLRRQFEKFRQTPVWMLKRSTTLLGANGQRPSEAKSSTSLSPNWNQQKQQWRKNKKNKSGAISTIINGGRLGGIS